MIKQFAALAAAVTLGAGSATAVLTSVQGAKVKYTSHAVDIRAVGVTPDGGVAVTVKAYATRKLLDGGSKDVGGHNCPRSPQIDSAGAALLVATEACVKEDL